MSESITSEEGYTQLKTICAVVGLLYIIQFSIFLFIDLWIGFKTFISPLISRQVDLKHKYGPWAVITGCTDGIGKEFAIEYAKRGLNICLISRSKEKLLLTAEQLESQYGVSTKCIQVDFSKTDIYSRIRGELKDLDIGILVNNVGILMGAPEPFVIENEDFLWATLNINIASTVLMTSIVAPAMIRRRRGVIVNMSSSLGELPSPLFTVYCASKSFINTFSRCLTLELKKENIRVQCLLAGWVNTKMLENYDNLDFMRKFLPWHIPSASTYARSAVNTLSSANNYTCGYWAHSLILTCTKFTLSSFKNFLARMTQLAMAGF